MLKISKAAMLAAVLSLSAVPAMGLVGAVAEERSFTTMADLTTTIAIPTITAVDSTMDETALRDVFTGGFMKHVDELAGLSATSITIPEITLKVTVTTPDGPVVTSVSYKDIVLSGVKDGVAASASVGSAESSSAEGSFIFGKMAASTFNLAGILGLYGLVEGGGDQSMQTLYKDFSFDGGSFSGPKASCTFGKVSAAEFDARPLKVSFAELMDASAKLGAAKDNPPPEAVATLVSFLADIFQAFKSEPMTIDGLSCKGTAEDGSRFDVAIGGLTVDGYAPGIYPALTVKAIRISDGGVNSISLDEAVLKSIDLSAPIAALEAEGKDLTPAWFEANYRKLIPAFGGISLSGLAVDVPNLDVAGARIKANIGAFDVTLSDYINGVPTRIATSASGIDVPLPQDSTDDQVKMLLALGLTRVNLGYEFSVAWDKATETVTVDKLSVSGADLGSIAVAAVIGNAAEQLFDVDPNVAEAASMGLTLKGVTLDVSDAGLGDILTPMLAAQQGVDPAGYRTQMAGALEGMTLQILGSTDAARALGKAVGDFVAGKAKALTVDIAAKDPAGIPVPVLMQAENDPMALTSQVEITGTAK